MLIVIDGDDHGPEPFEIYESDDPEVEYEGPEGTYSDTQLAEMLMSANPQLSVAEIDALLHEPRKLLSRFKRQDLQQVEREVWEIVPGYPVTCDVTRQSIMEATVDPKNIPKLQLVVLIRAVEAFSRFVTIRCNDDHTLERFVIDYADAAWWAELWDDLVKAHGDQTPHFFI
jgi:hypothetical protein